MAGKELIASHCREEEEKIGYKDPMNRESLGSSGSIIVSPSVGLIYGSIPPTDRDFLIGKAKARRNPGSDIVVGSDRPLLGDCRLRPLRLEAPRTSRLSASKFRGVSY